MSLGVLGVADGPRETLDELCGGVVAAQVDRVHVLFEQHRSAWSARMTRRSVVTMILGMGAPLGRFDGGAGIAVERPRSGGSPGLEAHASGREVQHATLDPSSLAQLAPPGRPHSESRTALSGDPGRTLLVS